MVFSQPRREQKTLSSNNRNSGLPEANKNDAGDLLPTPTQGAIWGLAWLADSKLEGRPHSGGVMGASKGDPLKNKE